VDIEKIMSKVPDKQYYRIGEVAEITRVKPYVLRFWETEFKMMAPPKSRSKQRMYRRKEIETILRIKELLYERGFTIKGARKRLAAMARGDLDALTIGEHLAAVRRDLEQIEALLA
jgi:DNA-binding transcriptional MerR regulator